MKFINKKTIFLAAATAALSIVSSCERDYLETVPTDGVSDVLAASSIENLNIILNGMHRNYDLYGCPWRRLDLPCYGSKLVHKHDEMAG